jgi:hypothetical protein
VAVILDQAGFGLLDQTGENIYDQDGPPAGWLFNGYQTLTYPEFIDATTASTLVAVPGQTYQIRDPSLSGLGDSLPPDNQFWSST